MPIVQPIVFYIYTIVLFCIPVDNLNHHRIPFMSVNNFNWTPHTSYLRTPSARTHVAFFSISRKMPTCSNLGNSCHVQHSQIITHCGALISEDKHCTVTMATRLIRDDGPIRQYGLPFRLGLLCYDETITKLYWIHPDHALINYQIVKLPVRITICSFQALWGGSFSGHPDQALPSPNIKETR